MGLASKSVELFVVLDSPYEEALRDYLIVDSKSVRFNLLHGLFELIMAPDADTRVKFARFTCLSCIQGKDAGSHRDTDT